MSRGAPNSHLRIICRHRTMSNREWTIGTGNTAADLDGCVRRHLLVDRDRLHHPMLTAFSKVTLNLCLLLFNQVILGWVL